MRPILFYTVGYWCTKTQNPNNELASIKTLDLTVKTNSDLRVGNLMLPEIGENYKGISNQRLENGRQKLPQLGKNRNLYPSILSTMSSILTMVIESIVYSMAILAYY